MSSPATVLLLGATGRTGGMVLQQLLGRGLAVRAIVRSRAKLPQGTEADPRLTVVEASLLSLADEEIRQHLRGCAAVVSCLGHVPNLKGIYGGPRDLVTRATERLCRGLETLGPPSPVKFILLSSVSVNRPDRPDGRRGPLERAFLRVLCLVLPPARDNQRAAEFLHGKIGRDHPFVQWAVVRPDSLQEGDLSEYRVDEGLVNSLAAPGRSNMANVAHFLGELVEHPDVWAEWKGQMPVLINAAPGRS
ncbi:MAG: NAD(P)H-binding protein [Acidobacteria bacterium]|nr:NAD(P)H-binding protein [Acidobacteriota bacterium]